MTKQLATILLTTACLVVTQLACTRASIGTSGGADGGASAASAIAGSVCPAIYYESNIQLTYTSVQTLPSQLAVSINGNPVGYDTCDVPAPSSILQSPVLTVVSATQVQISVSLDSSQALSSTYFVSGSAAPASNQISYQLFGRTSCGDPLQPIVNHQNLQLNWQPVYAAGSGCGLSGYQSTTSDQ